MHLELRALLHYLIFVRTSAWKCLVLELAIAPHLFSRVGVSEGTIESARSAMMSYKINNCSIDDGGQRKGTWAITCADFHDVQGALQLHRVGCLVDAMTPSQIVEQMQALS